MLDQLIQALGDAPGASKDAPTFPLAPAQRLIGSLERRILARLPVAVFVYEIGTAHTIYANPFTEQMLGYEVGELTMNLDTLASLIFPDDRERIERANDQLVKGEVVAVEYRMRHADGTWRLVATRLIVFQRDADGNAVLAVGAAIDATDIRRAQNRDRHFASHDPLTEIFNRRRLETELEGHLSHGPMPLTICMCDIDHFKDVNDTYGHTGGDQVLRAFADMMKKHLRREDILARFGGDEFCILLPNCDVASAVQVIKRLHHHFRRHTFTIGERRFRVSASFGVAPLELDYTVERALQLADQALYHAKRSGRDCISTELGDGGPTGLAE